MRDADIDTKLAQLKYDLKRQIEFLEDRVQRNNEATKDALATFKTQAQTAINSLKDRVTALENPPP